MKRGGFNAGASCDVESTTSPTPQARSRYDQGVRSQRCCFSGSQSHARLFWFPYIAREEFLLKPWSFSSMTIMVGGITAHQADPEARRPDLEGIERRGPRKKGSILNGSRKAIEKKDSRWALGSGPKFWPLPATSQYFPESDYVV